MIQFLRTLLLSVLLFLSTNLWAQEQIPHESNRNHAIAINCGGLLGPVVSLNYEYTISRSFLKGNNILYTRIGSGYMGFWGGDYGFMAAQLGLLTGADKNHHLDFGIGPLMTFPYDGLMPFTLTAAYRFQKPDGKTYFRIGGGVVEGFQLSAGFRF